MDTGPFAYSDPAGSALGWGAAFLVASLLGPAIRQAGQAAGTAPGFVGAAVKENVIVSEHFPASFFYKWENAFALPGFFNSLVRDDTKV